MSASTYGPRKDDWWLKSGLDRFQFDEKFTDSFKMGLIQEDEVK